jgi:DNA-nicking Smr family endonuclease
MARGPRLTPRLTAEDHAAWAHYAQHIAKLPGRTNPAPPPANQPPADPPPDPSSPATPPPEITGRAKPAARPGPARSPLAIGAPPAGVDKSTWQRFRTGKLAAPRTLDLHGMTVQAAFHALTTFLHAAHADHIRCVEIVTGSGRREGTGVLRRELPHWLNRPDLRPLILGAAHPHVANQGSVRLLLRRIR